MSLQALDMLVSEARSLANDHPCMAGHLWESQQEARIARFQQDPMPINTIRPFKHTTPPGRSLAVPTLASARRDFY